MKTKNRGPVASVLFSFRNIDLKRLLKTKSVIQGKIYLLIGLLFMMAPHFATKSIGMGLGLAALFWLGKRLTTHAFSQDADQYPTKYKLIFY